MSNEIKIEKTERDYHMYEETHYDSSCAIVEKVGTYINNTRGLVRTLEVQIFFMVCNCRKNSRNQLPRFLQGHWINVGKGESVDPHLPNKECSYKQYHQ